MKTKRILTALLFFCACAVGWAQPARLSFEAITTTQGLSNNSVTAIRQDSEGFMWFGTAAGLTKYDGYNFTVFRANPQKTPNSLHNDIVWGIQEDQKGRLWISTLGDGLYQLNEQTQQLTAHRLSTLPDRQYMNIFYSIYQESQKLLWVGSQLGLVWFDLESKRMRLYPLPAPNEVVFCITQDQTGHLWVGTKMGLYRFDRKTGYYSLVRLLNQPLAKQPLVSALYLDGAGMLWVGTNGEALFKLGAQGAGLFKVNTHETLPSATAYQVGGLIKKNIALNGIVSYSGELWVATDEGLQQIDPRTNRVRTYRATPFSANTLSSSNILSLYPDRDGNLWVGTDNGVNKVVNTTKQFLAYQVKPTMPSVRIIDNTVTSILQDHTGTIWLGNHVKGLYRFDPRQDSITHQLAALNNPHALLSNHVWAIFEDSRKQLWVSTLEGMHLFDSRTGRTARYPAKIPVQYIAEAPDGQLWIGGKKGIASFNPATGRYHYLDTAISAGFNFVTGLVISRNGNLWIAQQGELQQFNPHTATQIHYQPSLPLKSGELTDGDVTTLFEDSRGLIWVGTARGGLNCFNPATETFSVIPTSTARATSAIAGIIEDDKGNLWVSTENGIFRYNIRTKAFRPYDNTDGLPASEFTKGSASRSGKTLLFGSVNGFVIFNPDSIRDNPVKPAVYITGLKVLGKSHLLPPSKKVVLAHTENSVAFDFVALNYHSPEKNQFAYKLEGIDADWVKSGTRRFANYTKLSPATYVFRVKASNDDGVWNNQGTSLTIVITSPWWRTWWAYLLYSLLVGAVLWAISTYRSRVLQRANRLLEQKVTERTQQVQHQKEEIEQQRDNLNQALTELKVTQQHLIQKEKMASLGELTAGIAHEIQNPLNFVNNFAEVSAELVEELTDEQQKPERDLLLEADLLADVTANLHKILTHGQRASTIIKGMVEHARSSVGASQPTNLNALVEDCLHTSYRAQRARDSAFSCTLATHFDATIEQVDVVPQEIGRALINLFANAFYAVSERQKQGTPAYQPTVQVSTSKMSPGIEIRVSDNGSGISESIQTKIFQPFFTTKPAGQGIGLGLSLAYDIITKGHGGKLTVTSLTGYGTEFVIYLPA
jgi:ligand-binding sensor domain-containing protein/signal transduction histidine kinase